MKSMLQMVKLSRYSKAPLLEKEFLRLYSRWHETHDQSLEKRIFMSLNRLMNSEPSFDFRERLWQAL